MFAKKGFIYDPHNIYDSYILFENFFNVNVSATGKEKGFSVGLNVNMGHVSQCFCPFIEFEFSDSILLYSVCMTCIS